MTKEETIKVLQSIEERAAYFHSMTASDWVAISSAKRHLNSKWHDVIVQPKFNLKATEEQQSFIESSFLEDTSIVQWEDDGIYLDDFISFDEMAKIVDYLRSNITKRK